MIKFTFWKGDSAVHFHSSVAVTTSQTKGHSDTIKEESNAWIVCYNDQALCAEWYKCLKFLSFDWHKVKIFILPSPPIHCCKHQMSRFFFFFNFIIRKEIKADRKLTKTEKEKKKDWHLLSSLNPSLLLLVFPQLFFHIKNSGLLVLKTLYQLIKEPLSWPIWHSFGLVSASRFSM